MPGGSDFKVATVDVESGDNMATLPVSRAHTGSSATDTAEKNNAANKEMELKNVMPKPLQRYTIDIHHNSEHIRWIKVIIIIKSVDNYSNDAKQQLLNEDARQMQTAHIVTQDFDFFSFGEFAFCADFCWYINHIYSD